MNGARSRSPLDRLLRLFADVRAGEGRNVLLLALNVFLLLTAYYILKPLRDGLILSEIGPEFTAYSSAAMALLLVPLVVAYGKLADRYPRRRLIAVVTIFFAACCAVFFLLGRMGVPIGLAYFVWVGIFNVMIIAQFWSFANDVYTNQEGERLFPIVQVGAAVGGIVGAVTVGQMIEPLGLFYPMLVAGALLLASLLITYYVDRREWARTESTLPVDVSTVMSPAATGEFRLATGEFKNLREALREALERVERGEAEPGKEAAPDRETRPGQPAGIEDEPEDGDVEVVPGQGAFRLVLRTRYLLYIGLLIALLNWVNTNGENLLNFALKASATQAVATGTAGGMTEGEWIGAFRADFYSVVNAVTLGVQLFLVSRIIRYLGVRTAILFLPVIALGTYGIIAFVPLLSAIRWGKTAENSMDYSLQSTVQHTLFLPTTREQKYKAKQVIDSFFKRAGDTLAAVTVLVISHLVGGNVRYFAILNVLLLVGWLFLAWRIGRMYQRLVDEGRPPLTSVRRKAA